MFNSVHNRDYQSKAMILGDDAARAVRSRFAAKNTVEWWEGYYA